jgi:hypothetical protein
VRFWAFLGTRVREFKNTTEHVFAKSPMSKTFPKKIDKFRCQFFLDFFGFIAFSGVSQQWEIKHTRKNVLQKKCVEKLLLKNWQKFLTWTFYKNMLVS